MWQRTENAALELLADLDTAEFVLGPRLATGSLRLCCQILHMYRQRETDSGYVSSAFAPLGNIWKNLTDKPLRAKVVWDYHYFALYCMQKRFVADARASHGNPSDSHTLKLPHKGQAADQNGCHTTATNASNSDEQGENKQGGQDNISKGEQLENHAAEQDLGKGDRSDPQAEAVALAAAAPAASSSEATEAGVPAVSPLVAPAEQAAAIAAAAAVRAGGDFFVGPGEQQEDAKIRSDLSAELYAFASDRTLLCFWELVPFVDLSRALPNWAAVLIRLLLLIEGKRTPIPATGSGGGVGTLSFASFGPHARAARKLFEDSFCHSPLVRRLVWESPAPVPALWLSDVAQHAEASRVLLRVLMKFHDMDAASLCNLVEHVLLARFLSSPHCAHTLLPSELMNDIVGAFLDAGRKVRGMAPRLSMPPLVDARLLRRCPEHWESQHLLWRLENLGKRLFHVVFVFQQGFLPHVWPDCLAQPQQPGTPMPIKVDASPGRMLGHCRAEPLVVRIAGTCLWDEGLLVLELLHSIMEQGRALPHEPILHFGRQVIMRHLWRRLECRGFYCSPLKSCHIEEHEEDCGVPQLTRLWELACWSLCEDVGLLREALEFLKGAYRELQSENLQIAWQPEHEDALFRMFLALDLSLLHGLALLSPWVPAQVQTLRLLVQQQPAEQFHDELHQEVASATESLKAISQKAHQLSNKLNIVEQRTVINKSQITDAIVTVEDQQRKRRESALKVPRRGLPVASN